MSELLYLVVWKSPERPDRFYQRMYMLEQDADVCQGYFTSHPTQDGYDIEGYSVRDEKLFLRTLYDIQILHEYECEVFKHVDFGGKEVSHE